MSCRGRSPGAPGLHLERGRDRVGGSRTAWCADYWRGECPALGWWWRVSKKSYIPSQSYEIAKNGEKRAVSRTFWPITRKKRRFSL
jgi:hypothetical protein